MLLMFNPQPKKKPGKKDKISSREFRELYASKTRKKKKYRNKSKVYTSAIHGTKTFHSIKEANYCEELDLRLQSGEIKHYDLQHKFDIHINGRHWRNYYIDFRVVNADDSITYVEVKGFETEVWRMKWDALLFQIDDYIEEGAELIVVK